MWACTHAPREQGTESFINRSGTIAAKPSVMTHRQPILASLFALTFVAACGDEAPEPTSVEAPSPLAAPSLPELTATTPRAPSSILDAPASAESVTQADTTEAVRVDALDARRVALARSVDAREPVDPSTSFVAEDAPLYAFFELGNRGGAERHPVVVFIGPDGQERGLVELEIPADAPRWRTWAYSRNVRIPGDWRVELRDEDGAVIAEQEFTLEGEE
jgi:hypothetical protein